MEHVTSFVPPDKYFVSISYIGMEQQHLVVKNIITHTYGFVNSYFAKKTAFRFVNRRVPRDQKIKLRIKYRPKGGID